MKFSFELFNELDTKELRKEYLYSLDKEQFKHKPFGSSYILWKCPDPNCSHHSLNKANLYKHIMVPCKVVSQWTCPFNYWQDDLCMIGDFNLQYPDIYVEKLFKNSVIKRIAEYPESKDHIFKVFPLKVFGNLWSRGKFRTFTRTVDNLVWIKDKNLKWVDSKTAEGKQIIKNIIDKHLLDFIAKNITGWASWHSGNTTNMNLFYEFRDTILHDRENPHIIEI